jgi:hypothetical protein
VTTHAKEVLTLLGVLLVSGTVLSAIWLRVLRWAGWTTAIKDALHLMLGVALVDVAYVHLADRLVFDQLGTLAAVGGITTVMLAIGCVLLRRHPPMRALLTGAATGVVLTSALTTVLLTTTRFRF